MRAYSDEMTGPGADAAGLSSNFSWKSAGFLSADVGGDSSTAFGSHDVKYPRDSVICARKGKSTVISSVALRVLYPSKIC